MSFQLEAAMAGTAELTGKLEPFTDFKKVR